MAKKRTVPAAASRDDIKDLLRGSLAELRTAVKDEGQKFFPNGIELIDVQVTVGTVTVKLKVAGPKAGTLMEATL